MMHEPESCCCADCCIARRDSYPEDTIDNDGGSGTTTGSREEWFASLQWKPDPYRERLLDVFEEICRAKALHGPEDFTSVHEGYAIILEELDELWDEVKLKASKRSKENMRTEAIQLAAMAVRFATELT